MMETQTLPGTQDVWLYDLLENGRELRCESALTFAYFLCSDSTKQLKVSSLTSCGIPRARFEVIGPVAEDGKPLTASYLLNRGEFQRLPGEIRDSFISKMPELMAPVIPSWRVYAVVGFSR